MKSDFFVPIASVLAIITSLRCIINDFFRTNNEEVGSNHSEEFSDEEEADETNGNYLSRYTSEGRGVLGTCDCIFAAQCFGSGSGLDPDLGGKK